jgi:hypothetical protein
LSGRLRKAATFLRKVGIEINYTKEGRARTRIIHIAENRTLFNPDKSSTQPSGPSANGQNSNGIKGIDGISMQTVGGTADGRMDGNDPNTDATVCANTLKNNDEDDADGADANIPSQSGPEKTRHPGWRKKI